MKICSKCKSDVITTNNHVGLKVVLCIVLLFLPAGIFYFWLPLLISTSYQCGKCEGSEILELDWREFEELKEEMRSSHPQPVEQFEFDYCDQYSSNQEEEDK